MQKPTKKTIPIFYAADENYLPYLSTSIHSLADKASEEYNYEIYVLNAGMRRENAQPLFVYERENLHIHLVDVSKKMQEVNHALQLRDYYTGATYYRIFIAELFPEYEKALYLDSDTILLGDVSELFNAELGDNLVGAIADGAVAAVEEFRLYTKGVLGIDASEYFNAGELLINLNAFREQRFYENFCSLLKAYKFSVAQDQDYLNVLCKGKVCFLGGEWNRMPITGAESQPKLIHYNLTLKPWHYEDTLFKEYFWEYARKDYYYQRILGELNTYTQEKRDKDAASEVALRALCLKEVEREDNYIKRFANA